jgi:hypothetical protein
MIVNFYKVRSNNYRNPVLIASKNISVMPPKGTFIELSGQVFRVENILLNLDTCEYTISVVRV